MALVPFKNLLRFLQKKCSKHLKIDQKDLSGVAKFVSHDGNISTFIWPFGIIKRIFLTYSEINPTLLLLLEPRLPCDMKKRYQFFSTLSSYQKLSKYICLFPIDIVFTRTCADCKERRAENIIMKLGMVLNGMVLNELFCFWSKKAAKIKPDTFICLNLHCQGPTGPSLLTCSSYLGKYAYF